MTLLTLLLMTCEMPFWMFLILVFGKMQEMMSVFSMDCVASSCLLVYYLAMVYSSPLLLSG